MKKVLFTATVDSHILQFHIPYLKYFKEQGYEVHVATNGDEKIPYCDKKHKVSFERSPIKINNLRAIKQLRNIIGKEKFEIIHCHTPMGSVVTRLAAKKARKEYNTRVIYTTHGFHFYKEAPLLNWIIYYPIEKWLSKYTDCLITINKEDYELAKKKFKAESIELVHGVGVTDDKFNAQLTENEKEEFRNSLNLQSDDFVISYVAELNSNKNQKLLINSVKTLENDIPNIKVLLIGTGEKEEEYRQYIKKLNLDKKIYLLGYRKDIANILRISNMAVSTSLREGLGLNVIEYCLNDLPVVASRNRGHIEIIKDGKNGYLFDANDLEGLKEKILYVYQHYNEEAEKMKKNHCVIEKFKLSNVIKNMQKIYSIT